MKIVYLDQNAASLLVKSDSQPIWRKILQVLKNGFRENKLVCPLPFEGILETAPKDLQFRREMESLFWDLSAGVAFKAFTDMSKELTLAIVRPAQDWHPWTRWRPVWAEMNETAQKVSSDWNAAKLHMNARMRDFVRSPNLSDMSERKLLHAVAAQRSIRICKDLERLLDSSTVDDSYNCRWLMEFLLQAHLSRAEILALDRAIKHHAWAAIPLHAFELLLGTKWEYDSIRGGSAPYHPNDEIDRKRAAMALNHADFFLTEGDMANLCRKARLERFCPTIVLSVRSPEAILEALRSVPISTD